MYNENANKVIILLYIVALLLICLENSLEKSITSSHNKTPIKESVINDTINTTSIKQSSPTFMDKSPKDGLKDALVFYNIKCPDIVYAQAILETGHFKSKLCVEDNNLFGLYDSKNKRYYKFNHWTENVIAYKKWIQSRYKHPEDYYEFLNRIHYARDASYILKLKQIVRKENDKKRYIKGDTISKRK